jgi:putative PIG3 family NAD(P)H quinone oxidoreductase
MKAVLLKKYGGPEVLQIGETDKPTPAEGQVRVKVMATSVNQADIVQREGNYAPPEGESEILGLEIAGVIDALGPAVKNWKVGQRVMSLVAGGGYGQYAVAYDSHLISIPDSMSYPVAACVCEAYITAFLNIFMIGAFKDGQAVLLHGGGGGVNTAAVQLCRTLTPNAKILVTASSAKIDRVKKLGVDVVINYQEQDFAAQVLEHTEQKGVHLILDHVGAQYLSANLNALAIEGKLMSIGVISGARAELNLARIMVKRQQIIGSVLRPRPIREKGQIVAEFKRKVLPLFADGTLVPLISHTFSLEDVAEAHKTMEASRHFGKIVLTVA